MLAPRLHMNEATLPQQPDPVLHQHALAQSRRLKIHTSKNLLEPCLIPAWALTPIGCDSEETVPVHTNHSSAALLGSTRDQSSHQANPKRTFMWNMFFKIHEWIQQHTIKPIQGTSAVHQKQPIAIRHQTNPYNVPSGGTGYTKHVHAWNMNQLSKIVKRYEAPPKAAHTTNAPGQSITYLQVEQDKQIISNHVHVYWDMISPQNSCQAHMPHLPSASKAAHAAGQSIRHLQVGHDSQIMFHCINETKMSSSYEAPPQCIKCSPWLHMHTVLFVSLYPCCCFAKHGHSGHFPFLCSLHGGQLYWFNCPVKILGCLLQLTHGSIKLPNPLLRITRSFLGCQNDHPKSVHKGFKETNGSKIRSHKSCQGSKESCRSIQSLSNKWKCMILQPVSTQWWLSAFIDTPIRIQGAHSWVQIHGPQCVLELDEDIEDPPATKHVQQHLATYMLNQHWLPHTNYESQGTPSSSSDFIQISEFKDCVDAACKACSCQPALPQYQSTCLHMAALVMIRVLRQQQSQMKNKTMTQ